jgi:hypothetical protein
MLDHFLGTIHGSLNALFEHHKVSKEESQEPQHAGEQENYINTIKLEAQGHNGKNSGKQRKEFPLKVIRHPKNTEKRKLIISNTAMRQQLKTFNFLNSNITRQDVLKYFLVANKNFIMPTGVSKNSSSAQPRSFGFKWEDSIGQVFH